jgi:hypothetical protein
MYTLAGFDLTTHNSADGDDTTRPHRQGSRLNGVSAASPELQGAQGTYHWPYLGQGDVFLSSVLSNYIIVNLQVVQVVK